MNRLLTAVLMLWLTATTVFADGQSIQMPDPALLVTPGADSISVLRLRPGRPGSSRLMTLSWRILSKQVKGKFGPALSMGLLALKNRNPADEFIPGQAVRVDTFGQGGKPVPNLAMTLSNYPGLQNLFWPMLEADAQGNKYPSREFNEYKLVLREGWDDPTRARVMTRVGGTTLSAGTMETVRSLIPAVNSGRRYRSELAARLTKLERNADSYGMVVNQNGSLLGYLEWLDSFRFQQMKDYVGGDKVSQLVGGVRQVSWAGEFTDYDMLKVRATLELDGANAEEVAQAVKKLHGFIPTVKTPSQVVVDFAVPYKTLVRFYLNEL